MGVALLWDGNGGLGDLGTWGLGESLNFFVHNHPAKGAMLKIAIEFKERSLSFMQLISR